MSGGPATRSFREQYWYFILALMVLVLYGRSLFGDFVLDDRMFFLDNDILPYLKPWDLRAILFSPSNYWGGELLPLRELLFVVEYHLFGPNPVGYHIVSIVLYSVLCGLVFSFLRTVLESGTPQEPASPYRSQDIPAFFATALFLAHPAHVEVVAYISSQKDLLYSLFSLCSLYAFYRYCGHQERGKALYALGVLFYYLALLSKLTAIGLALFVPLIFLLAIKGTRLLRSLGLWAVANVPAALWILWYTRSMDTYWHFNTSALNPLPFAARTMVSLKILGAHTVLALKPFPLSFGYPFAVSRAVDVNFIVGGLTAAFLLLAVFLFRRDRVLIIGCAFYGFFLLPVLQLQGSIGNASIYDRYLFLPLLGLCMIAARLAALPSSSARRRLGYPVGLVVIIYAGLTLSYVPAFKDELAVTRNTYDLFPDWPTSSFNYVYALIERGRLDEAYEFTLKEGNLNDPPWVRPYFLGWILLEKNNVDAALANLQIASVLAVSGGYFPFPNVPLAQAFVREGNKPAAKILLRAAMTSSIYQPLEFYRAKKILEAIE